MKMLFSILAVAAMSALAQDQVIYATFEGTTLPNLSKPPIAVISSSHQQTFNARGIIDLYKNRMHELKIELDEQRAYSAKVYGEQQKIIDDLRKGIESEKNDSYITGFLEGARLEKEKAKAKMAVK